MEGKGCIYDVVKEYIFKSEELDFAVHGRICREKTKDSVSDEFIWEISHYYRPSEKAASVYIPSQRTSSNLHDAELKLMLYMRNFTNIDVTRNEFY